MAGIPTLRLVCVSAGLLVAPMGAIASLSTPTLAESPADVTRLIDTGSCAMCDLTDADLRGVDLEGADLSGASLSGADLSHANLQHTNLNQAVLNGANLSGADFSFANLRNASLQGATILQPANFTGADLANMTMPSGLTRTPVTSPTGTVTNGTAGLDNLPAGLMPMINGTPHQGAPSYSTAPNLIDVPNGIESRGIESRDIESRDIDNSGSVAPPAAPVSTVTPDGQIVIQQPAALPAALPAASAESTSIDPRFPLLDSRFPLDPLAPSQSGDDAAPRPASIEPIPVDPRFPLDPLAPSQPAQTSP